MSYPKKTSKALLYMFKTVEKPRRHGYTGSIYTHNGKDGPPYYAGYRFKLDPNMDVVTGTPFETMEEAITEARGLAREARDRVERHYRWKK